MLALATRPLTRPRGSSWADAASTGGNCYEPATTPRATIALVNGNTPLTQASSGAPTLPARTGRRGEC
eukprot:498863-Pyramimonas_sp.AAC.1